MSTSAPFVLALPTPTPGALVEIRQSLIGHFGPPDQAPNQERWHLPDPAELPTKLGPIKLRAAAATGGATVEVPFSLRSWVQESTKKAPEAVRGKGLTRYAFTVRLPFRLALFGSDCWIYSGLKGAE